MGFDNLPDVPPLILPGGPEYAEYSLRRSREAAAKVATDLDVAYGDDRFQHLDVYFPEQASHEALPTVMFVHGGAWSKGHKEWMGFMAPAILEIPAIFVSIDHRLVPHVQHPAPVDDCAAALDWLRSNVHQYGGSPDCLFVGGHSSGGHLAALLTLRARQAKPTIRGCIVISAPINLDMNVADGRRAQLIRDLVGEDGDSLDASPLHLVEGNNVPFLVAYGTEDLPEVMTYGKSFIEKLEGEKGGVRSLVLDGMGHFDTNLACEHVDSTISTAIRTFIESNAS